MSTLRISNIEAKSVPASATIDEKVKITNSSGDVLVFLDGKTSGITTVGINTTDGNITFDANSNVVVTGIITATKFVGTIEPTNLTVGGDLTIPDKIIHSGDTNTAIRFPAADTISAETDSTERLRISSSGLVNIGAGSSASGLSPILHLHKNASSTAYLHITNNNTGITNNDGFLLGINGVGDCLVFNKDSTPIRFATAGAERLRIASGGQVIIGDDDIDKANGNFDDLIVGANASTTETHGITIVCGNAATNGGIAFSDGGAGGADAYRGMISYQHNDNHMQFRTNAVERLRINSSGQVIMTNASTTTFFDASTTSSGSATRGLVSLAGKTAANAAVTLKMGGFGDTGRGEIFTHSNHDLGFATNNAAAQWIMKTGGNLQLVDGNLVVANGHGIDFSATGNAGGMTSELLDDYEEGDHTTSVTMSGDTSFTYVSRVLAFTKIGRVVHVTGRLHLYGCGGSSFEFTLPFTSGSGNKFETSNEFQNIRFNDDYTFRINGGTSSATLQNDGSTVSIGADNVHLNVNLTYFTA